MSNDTDSKSRSQFPDTPMKALFRSEGIPRSAANISSVFEKTMLFFAQNAVEKLMKLDIKPGKVKDDSEVAPRKIKPDHIAEAFPKHAAMVMKAKTHIIVRITIFDEEKLEEKLAKAKERLAAAKKLRWDTKLLRDKVIGLEKKLLEKKLLEKKLLEKKLKEKKSEKEKIELIFFAHAPTVKLIREFIPDESDFKLTEAGATAVHILIEQQMLGLSRDCVLIMAIPNAKKPRATLSARELAVAAYLRYGIPLDN